MNDKRRVLVIGATGYIGSHLIPHLLQRGNDVAVLARTPEKVKRHPWHDQVTVFEGDVLDIETLPAAFENMDVIYYLVHSLGKGNFAERDRHAAYNTALIADRQKVGRIIYLSGMGHGPDLSEHLASRQETGRVLAGKRVPVTEFRAAVVVGAGSDSFRIIHYLAKRLPVMITPKWVQTRTQPIAEADVLRYLAEAPERPESTGKILEIGGDDVMSYGDMMRTYSRIRGLHRLMIPVPVLTPRLSAYWVDLTTPIPAGVSHPLIEGLKNEVVVRDPAAREIFPFEPMAYEHAVRLAIKEMRRERAAADR